MISWFLKFINYKAIFNVLAEPKVEKPPYAVLQGIIPGVNYGSRFITDNRGDLTLCQGKPAYKVVCYANSMKEAQELLSSKDYL